MTRVVHATPSAPRRLCFRAPLPLPLPPCPATPFPFARDAAPKFNKRALYIRGAANKTKPRSCAQNANHILHSVQKLQQTGEGHGQRLAAAVQLIDTTCRSLPPPSARPPKAAADAAAAAAAELHAAQTLTTLYDELKRAQILRTFNSVTLSSARSSTLQKARALESLATQADISLSSLTPRTRTIVRWQLAGALVVIVTMQLLRVVEAQQLAQPLLLALFCAYLLDMFILQGMVFESIYTTLAPLYAAKIITHESGHFLSAYLLGFGVQAYALSTRQARQRGLRGQGATLFSNVQLQSEMSRGQLSVGIIERYAVVLMGGIAAEAIAYGEAEGGDSDVRALLQLLQGLSPSWQADDVRVLARWAALQATILLRQHQLALRALSGAMREQCSVGTCVQRIEAAVR